jgi:Dynamin family
MTVDIAALLDEVAALAERLGDPATAARARSQAAATVGEVRAVVVGEQKRGKSSLVNALLEAPGLLPVDVDIATSVHVSVYAADQPQARAVREESGQDGIEIRLDQVAEYAALDPESGEMRHPDVTQVSVGVPSPLLSGGLVLIDTPGVGGLVSGHAALTLAALSMADALIFVVNGSSELTASECAFLGQATERVATVLFVLTQTDKYPQWRQVLATNQELIAQHAPAFTDAPWFPVSSRLRLDAVRAPAPDRAAELDRRSGFGPLIEALTGRIAGHAAELREANIAWAAMRLIDKLTADVEARLRSLAQDPALAEELKQRRARLNEARRSGASWMRSLESRFRELSRDVGRLYARRISELESAADRMAAEADAATATAVAHDFDAGVRALWADLEAGTRYGAARAATMVAAELGAEGVDALETDMPYPAELAELGSLELTEEGRAKGASAVLARYWPSLSGVSMTSMAAHLVLGSAVNPILLIGVGGVAAAMLYKSGRTRGDTARARADLARHMREVLGRARVEMPAAQQDAMAALRDEIERVISDRLRERDAEFEAAIADAAANVEAAEQDLAPKRAAAQVALLQLRQLAEQAAAVTGGRVADEGGRSRGE